MSKRLEEWSYCLKFTGTSTYGVPSKEEQIMAELMNHGPVEAAFTVYNDFLQYKSGQFWSDFFLLHFIVDGVKPSQNEIYSIKVWVIIVLHPLAFPSTWRQHVTIHKCGFPFDRYMTRSIRDYPLIVLDHLQSIAWSHAELHLWLLHSGGGQR